MGPLGSLGLQSCRHRRAAVISAAQGQVIGRALPGWVAGTGGGIRGSTLGKMIHQCCHHPSEQASVTDTEDRRTWDGRICRWPPAGAKYQKKRFRGVGRSLESSEGGSRNFMSDYFSRTFLQERQEKGNRPWNREMMATCRLQA